MLDAVPFTLETHPALKPGARVAVGLSGGVDSSVAALCLLNAGFRVVGLTMSIWDGSVPLKDAGQSGCFGPGEARDIEAAAGISRRLNIEHHVIPLAEEYRWEVLDYFRREYLAGRTPNPCVRCNRHVKFGHLLRRAGELGLHFDAFATGHYARTARSADTGRWLLLRAMDRVKDQTYFISHLSQEQLARTVFPLGGMTKQAVKDIARRSGFADLAERPESQDFIEAADHAALFAPGEARAGKLVDSSGQVRGEHRGIPFYTVGQRKGLGIGGAGEPLYVTGVDAARNEVRVGRKEDLYARIFTVRLVHWIAFLGPPRTPVRADVKIRQRHPGAPAVLIVQEDGLRVEFDMPQMSITPGQISVFYEGDFVLGAGVIDQVQPQ
ncbi:MAG: tRNA 2-thiouridine(34) synthase MnmA [Kiritimatiellae bacterium]|nr:tRNA 2-thiouridine(34) synthase MnmA [Kiritimatiellia bacterium]